MRLDKYLEERGEKPAGFAERIGVQRLAVYRYIRGLRRPTRHVMARISAATGGAVTANDFYELDDDTADASGEREAE